MPKSSFDEEVNKILNEINFAGILGGAAKLGTAAIGTAAKVGLGISGASGALGAAGIDVNKGIDATTGLAKKGIDIATDKANEYIKKFAESGDYNKNLKIDDNVIKSLNAVWGEVKDNTRYKSYADLASKAGSISSLMENFRGKTLGEVKQFLLNFLSK